MRIQHNISAMNSYRNFSSNNTKLSKNLEKLSTGYKINRAGDDAAGLAISEKMRAQITGIEGATKNSKDGISLIQTAEGALTEVHDMLNRMTTLAEQSANGTYQNELDREQLQKEVDALKSEIDRIADSTNFNGLKLLDGSLSSTGKNGVSADLSKLGIDVLSSAQTISSQKGTYTTGALLSTDQTAVAAGDEDKMQFTLKLNFTDADGNEQEVTKTLRVKTHPTANTTAGAAQFVLVTGDDDEDGTAVEYTAGATDADGQLSKQNLAAAFKAVLDKDATIKSNFTVNVDATDGGKLTFDAKMPGTNGASMNAVSIGTTADRTAAAPTTTTRVLDIAKNPIAEDSMQVYDMSKAKIWNNTRGDDSVGNQTRDLDEAVFEVNGKKFVFVNDNLTDSDVKKLTDAGVTNWVKTAAKTDQAPTAAKIQEMAKSISQATGLEVQTGHISQADTGETNMVNGVPTTVKKGGWNYVEEGATGTDSGTAGLSDVFVRFKDATGTTEGGLTLQIGDTSDEWNKLTVSVGDMHSKMIGVGDVDISTQKGAGEALDKIKSAINNVSDTRGNLGALQNRLDHTINNLGVMRENIQNAESTIRDTDVAEEMMAYTKNNILNQSAQAMLAQANQLPQGVLQLLG